MAQDTDARTADDLVAEADTGARNPSSAWQANLIIGTCILWSLFQLYIASKVPQKLVKTTLLGRPAKMRQFQFGGTQPTTHVSAAHGVYVGTKAQG